MLLLLPATLSLLMLVDADIPPLLADLFKVCSVSVSLSESFPADEPLRLLDVIVDCLRLGAGAAADADVRVFVGADAVPVNFNNSASCSTEFSGIAEVLLEKREGTLSCLIDFSEASSASRFGDP